jgi:hypothetical protein
MLEKNSLPLFLEDIYEALHAAVQALGGAKAVAAKLWPHKPIDQARKELLDALNRENPRKLDAEEIVALLRMAREANFHQAKHWLDRELGYEPSTPTDPAVEEDRLATALENATNALINIVEDVKRVRGKSPIPKLRGV